MRYTKQEITKLMLLKFYKFFFISLPTLFSCLISGLKYNRTWNVVGRPIVIRRKWYEKIFAKHNGGVLIIGNYFCCNNKIDSNSLGLIQPCVFNIAIDGSKIIIGNNVGISGATLNSAEEIRIEDNVLIGSGSIISDTNSHPIEYDYRVINDMSKTKTAPIHIKEGAFIGARCLILKGVTIGAHSIVGAGSVVTKSIPDNCIVGGNPAEIIRKL